MSEEKEPGQVDALMQLKEAIRGLRAEGISFAGALKLKNGRLTMITDAL